MPWSNLGSMDGATIKVKELEVLSPEMKEMLYMPNWPYHGGINPFLSHMSESWRLDKFTELSKNMKSQLDLQDPYYDISLGMESQSSESAGTKGNVDLIIA
jgi:hypothetical protein